MNPQRRPAFHMKMEHYRLPVQVPEQPVLNFFICIGNQNQFDAGGDTPPDGEGFAAFGKVIKGMDIARKIQELPKAGVDGFAEKIKIYKISRL